jgi:hypothetical protein
MAGIGALATNDEPLDVQRVALIGIIVMKIDQRAWPAVDHQPLAAKRGGQNRAGLPGGCEFTAAYSINRAFFGNSAGRKRQSSLKRFRRSRIESRELNFA